MYDNSALLWGDKQKFLQCCASLLLSIYFLDSYHQVSQFPRSGPAARHEVAGSVAHGAGGGGHAVRGREEGKDLLPRLLQTLPPQVQGVRRGELQTDHVQSKRLYVLELETNLREVCSFTNRRRP